MADPFSWIALGTSLIGTVGNTIAGVNQADATARAAKYEALDAQTAATYNAMDEARKAEYVVAKQRNIGAASGVQGASLNDLALQSYYEAGMNQSAIIRGGQQQYNAKMYEGELARSTKPGTIFSGALGLTSILGDWYSKYKFPSGGSSSSSTGWAGSVPRGRYSLGVNP